MYKIIAVGGKPGMTIDLINACCREAAAGLAGHGPLFSCIITDPPYALVSVTKRFGSPNAAPAKSDGPTGVYGRASAGFMGKTWDTGAIAFDPATWAALGELLPPGGHIAAFGGTRTFHRLACALEDAGFEVRDCLMWVYGTGFPKSHDVSKAIDKAAGAERTKIPVGAPVARMIPGANQNRDGSWIKDSGREYQPGVELPATPEAAQWEGWGTALKPAWEPIILARKPLEGRTVADCVLEFGTGALNIDACRIGDDIRTNAPAGNKAGGNSYNMSVAGMPTGADSRVVSGRWPANVLHDGSDEVIDAFPDARGQIAKSKTGEGSKTSNTFGAMGREGEPHEPRDNGGSAARFFYSAKAGPTDRAGSKHPTVKPVKLMRWLVDLLVPPGGRVLDPFAGSGTTGQACLEAGVDCVLIERDPEYAADIRRRFNLSEEQTR